MRQLTAGHLKRSSAHMILAHAEYQIPGSHCPVHLPVTTHHFLTHAITGRYCTPAGLPVSSLPCPTLCQASGRAHFLECSGRHDTSYLQSLYDQTPVYFSGLLFCRLPLCFQVLPYFRAYFQFSECTHRSFCLEGTRSSSTSHLPSTLPIPEALYFPHPRTRQTPLLASIYLSESHARL